MQALAGGRLSAVIPAWVPGAVRNYLFHTEIGLSIRALARAEGCHASTVLRQVRRYEGRRDDPLVDSALRSLGRDHFEHLSRYVRNDDSVKSVQVRIEEDAGAAAAMDARCIEALRKLCEPGALLAVAEEMEKSVVVREGPDGESVRTAIVEGDVAEALALREWITLKGAAGGRIVRYVVSGSGRNALKTLIAAKENAARNLSADPGDDEDCENRRFALIESPLVGLARRRDKDGQPFLSEELVRAGERLREDYELADVPAHRIERWLLDIGAGDTPDDAPTGDPNKSAAVRFYEAILSLGDGLGEIAFRCCCLMEGMEQTEKRMGWSARSGKVVLRIALQRLQRHYFDAFGQHGPMIY